MSLQITYVDDIIHLSTGGNGAGSYVVIEDSGTVVDHSSDNEHNPVALEIMFVSRYMPLETNDGYCSGTDTLVIGKDNDTATLLERNSDLVAYWAPVYCSDQLSLLAVELHNVSKHLAPVIADHANKSAYESGAELH